MEQFLNIARDQIAIALDDQQGALNKALSAITSKASAGGYLRSGRLIFELDRACAATISERGATVWRIVHNCITVGRVRFTPQLASTLKAFCRPYLSGTVQGLTNRARQQTEHMGMPPVETHESEAARDMAVRSLDSQIDLFCAALSVEPQDATYQPNTVINMTGTNYGAIQAGAQSTATVTVTTSTVYQDSIRSALDELKKELQALAHADAPMAIIHESEREVAKATPDKARLQSLFGGIKACLSSMIDTAPKIPAAIEGVQRAIAMLPM